MGNDLMQRKLLLSSLLNCAGFKALIEEMSGVRDGQKVLLENTLRTPFDHLGTVNFINGRLNGHNDFFDVIEGFREELEQLAVER